MRKLSTALVRVAVQQIGHLPKVHRILCQLQRQASKAILNTGTAIQQPDSGLSGMRALSGLPCAHPSVSVLTIKWPCSVIKKSPDVTLFLDSQAALQLFYLGLSCCAQSLGRTESSHAGQGRA